MAKIVIDTCYCIYLLEAPEEIVQHISEYIQKYILNGEGLGDGHQYLNKVLHIRVDKLNCFDLRRMERWQNYWLILTAEKGRCDSYDESHRP